jgi:DMSO/TMAO reductase YedYZ molybdopterin-dependent catalytic subunit
MTISPVADHPADGPQVAPRLATEHARTVRRTAVGAAAGGAAALTAAGLGLWAGRTFGGAIVAQLLADRATALVPVSVFGTAVGTLEANAKPLALLGLTAAQVAVGAVVGAGYALIARSGSRGRLRGAALLALLAWGIFAVVVAPLGNIGLLARHATGGAGETQLLFLLAAGTFGLLTAALVPWPFPAESRPDRSRRRLLRVAVAGVPALLAAGYTGWFARELRASSSVVPARRDADTSGSAVEAGTSGERFAIAGLSQPVTPVGEFYVVSKNFVDPTVDAARWELEIGGLVERPLRLSYSDLFARPAVEFTSTLECISNPVGGEYISTAVWRGVPLAALLEEAGLRDGIVDLELHADDGYVESIPVAEGLAPDTVLVHTMNDAPLTDKHGFPARLIVPGIYGMKNVKWLTRVLAVDEDILGYWQQRGWSDPAPVLTMSRIDTPRPYREVVVGQPLAVGGIAFSGDRGISRVEVTFDKGVTWQDAELSTPLSDLSWRLWRCDYTPQATGGLSITVRATDGTGEVQTSRRQPPLPNGSTGHHTITVKVVSGA